MSDELRRVRDWDLPRGRWVDLPSGSRTFVRELPNSPAAPTVVLLHGIATTGGLMWFATLSQLGESFRVLAPDLRGHGRSRCDGAFKLADAADDTVAMLDAMGIEQAILLGYSLGGTVAQLAAHRHPGRLAGLVLSATAARIGPRGAARAPMVAAGRVSTALSGLALRRAWFRPLPDEADHLGGPWGWFAAEMRGCHPLTIMEALSEIARFSSSSWLELLDVPTAVVVTQRDRVVPAQAQRAMAARIPGAKVFEVDAGHTAPGTAPEIYGPVATAACEWVTDTAATRRTSSSGRSRASR